LRIDYLQKLRKLTCQFGKQNIVYFDESGFQETVFNPYAWAPRGVKVYGEKTGNAKKNRTNLIMAQRMKEHLAPVLFTGRCDALVVEEWVENHLVSELKNPSVIVADNAPFHRKNKLREIAQKHGHVMLFLPPYSPDFNPIEQTFGVFKRRRLYNPHLSLENLINA
jgi:transposase